MRSGVAISTAVHTLFVACSLRWGRVLGPLLAGALLTHFGYRTAWSCFAVVVAVYFSWTLAQPREDDHPHPA